MNIFANSVAVITGGGSGIGAALAREAARRGAKVAIADIRLDSAKTIASEIGMTARAYHVDVTDPASVIALAAAIEHEMGGINLLFANAGVIAIGGLHETSVQDFEWMFDVNVLGLHRTIRAFLPSILAQAKQNKPAHIITTGSENSIGLPLSGATTGYTSTKHAVLGLSDGLRRDLAAHGVAVNILCPGMVVTNLADARSRRQDRYGGSIDVPREEMDQIMEFMLMNGQLPDETARLCCDGLERGEFMIICNPAIRQLAETRNDDIVAALAAIDSYISRASC